MSLYPYGVLSNPGYPLGLAYPLSQVVSEIPPQAFRYKIQVVPKGNLIVDPRPSTQPYPRCKITA